MIDAYTGDVSRRIHQLENSLADEHLPPCTSEERIVHLIPKRNIETWILNLNGNPVDEDTDYSRNPGVSGQITNAATKLFEWTRHNAVIPQFCVSSLRTAIMEIKRLEYEG